MSSVFLHVQRLLKSTGQCNCMGTTAHTTVMNLLNKTNLSFRRGLRRVNNKQLDVVNDYLQLARVDSRMLDILSPFYLSTVDDSSIYFFLLLLFRWSIFWTPYPFRYPLYQYFCQRPLESTFHSSLYIEFCTCND